MLIRVLSCKSFSRGEEFIGKVVPAYYIFSNGVNFVTRYGMIFLEKGEYEIVEK